MGRPANSPCHSRTPRNWTGAPCSQQHTWVENDGRPRICQAVLPPPMARTPKVDSRSPTRDGCPTSRSFFARCGIPRFFPSDSRFTRWTERSASLLFHISRKTSEIAGFSVRSTSSGTCTAFIEQSRVKFIDANKLHRKSGGTGHPSFVGKSPSAARPMRTPATASHATTICSYSWPEAEGSSTHSV
jgi:hypothetical protein